MIFNDNAAAAFGTSSDLKIYHNGSHSRIDNDGTGNLYINAASGETGISIIKNGSIAVDDSEDPLDKQPRRRKNSTEKK